MNDSSIEVARCASFRKETFRVLGFMLGMVFRGFVSAYYIYLIQYHTLRQYCIPYLRKRIPITVLRDIKYNEIVRGEQRESSN